MPELSNGNHNDQMDPEEALLRLDAKIASTQQKLVQLKLQLLNESKKLDKFLIERRSIESALHSSSFTVEPHTNGDALTASHDGSTDLPRPLPLRRMSSSLIITESPASPPPTTALSPPPIKNRLFAGHTPMLPAALSPSASTVATPHTAPSKPSATLAPYTASHRLAQLSQDSGLPEVEDDPHLEGPLTAQDDGFLGAVTEKLEKVKSDEDMVSLAQTAATTSPLAVAVISPPPVVAPPSTSITTTAPTAPAPSLEALNPALANAEHQYIHTVAHLQRDEMSNDDRDEFTEHNDELSPLSEKVPVLERVEGIRLKAKRSTNFGVPLGQLR